MSDASFASRRLFRLLPHPVRHSSNCCSRSPTRSPGPRPCSTSRRPRPLPRRPQRHRRLQCRPRLAPRAREGARSSSLEWLPSTRGCYTWPRRRGRMGAPSSARSNGWARAVTSLPMRALAAIYLPNNFADQLMLSCSAHRTDPQHSQPRSRPPLFRDARITYRRSINLASPGQSARDAARVPQNVPARRGMA